MNCALFNYAKNLLRFQVFWVKYIFEKRRGTVFAGASNGEERVGKHNIFAESFLYRNNKLTNTYKHVLQSRVCNFKCIIVKRVFLILLLLIGLFFV